MATLNLGRIKPVFQGAYSGSTAYVVDDIVTFGDETFICIQASTGNATSNASYWTKLAAKGTDGTNVGTTITTQGDILYRDGSGLQRLGAGTSGQYLKTQGTGANPVWGTVSATSDIEKIVSNTFSGVSAVDLNGLTTYFGATPSDYAMYHIYMSDMDFSTSTNLMMRQINSDVLNTGSYYSYATWAIQSNSSSIQVSHSESGNAFKLTRDSMRGDTGRLHGLEMTLVNINNNSDNKNYLQYWGRCSPVQHDSTGRVHATAFGGNFNSDTSYNTNKTGIRLYADSGTFSGRYTIYGVRK